MRSYLLLALILMVCVSSGCSDMIRSLRQENSAIDKEAADDDRDGEDGQQEQLAYRPRTLTGLSANNTRAYDPPVRRSYGRKLASVGGTDPDPEGGGASDVPASERRYTREDFLDRQAGENSLWDSQGQGNYLFSNNRHREAGDLVSVDVERDLKREIQYQLWLTLPPEQRRMRRAPASVNADETKVGNNLAAAGKNVADAAKGAAQAAAQNAVKTAEEKGKDAAEEAAKLNMPGSGKEDDIVRMEVVESLGNGLVRVVGQKRVIYRGQSRVVEITALVNNKDIDDQNKTKSSSFLDMQAQVIQ